MAEAKPDGIWGWLKTKTSSAANDDAPSTATKAHLGDENKFYYNKEIKRWVIKGEEHLIEEEAAVAPPPKMDEKFRQKQLSAQKLCSVLPAGRGRGASGLYASTPGIEVTAPSRGMSGFVPPPHTTFGAPNDNTREGKAQNDERFISVEKKENDHSEDTTDVMHNMGMLKGAVHSERREYATESGIAGVKTNDDPFTAAFNKGKIAEEASIERIPGWLHGDDSSEKSNWAEGLGQRQEDIFNVNEERHQQVFRDSWKSHNQNVAHSMQPRHVPQSQANTQLEPPHSSQRHQAHIAYQDTRNHVSQCNEVQPVLNESYGGQLFNDQPSYTEQHYGGHEPYREDSSHAEQPPFADRQLYGAHESNRQQDSEIEPHSFFQDPPYSQQQMYDMEWRMYTEQTSSYNLDHLSGSHYTPHTTARNPPHSEQYIGAGDPVEQNSRGEDDLNASFEPRRSTVEEFHVFEAFSESILAGGVDVIGKRKESASALTPADDNVALHSQSNVAGRDDYRRIGVKDGVTDSESRPFALYQIPLTDKDDAELREGQVTPYAATESRETLYHMFEKEHMQRDIEEDGFGSSNVTAAAPSHHPIVAATHPQFGGYRHGGEALMQPPSNTDVYSHRYYSHKDDSSYTDNQPSSLNEFVKQRYDLTLAAHSMNDNEGIEQERGGGNISYGIEHVEPYHNKEDWDNSKIEYVEEASQLNEEVSSKLLVQMESLQTVCENLKNQQLVFTNDFQNAWKEELKIVLDRIYSCNNFKELYKSMEGLHDEIEAPLAKFGKICDANDMKLRSLLNQIDGIAGMAIQHSSETSKGVDDSAVIELHEQLANALGLLEEAEGNISTYTTQIQQLQELCGRHESLLNKTQDMLLEIQRENDGMKYRIKSQNLTTGKLRDELNYYMMQSQSLQQKLNDGVTSNDEMHKVLRNRLKEIEMMRAEHEELTKEYKKVCNENESTQLENDKLTNIVNGLSVQMNNVMAMRNLRVEDDGDNNTLLKCFEAITLNFIEDVGNLSGVIKNKTEELNDMEFQLKESLNRENAANKSLSELRASSNSLEGLLDDMKMEKGEQTSVIVSLRSEALKLKEELDDKADKVEQVRKQCEMMFDKEMRNVHTHYEEKVKEFKRLEEQSRLRLKQLEDSQLRCDELHEQTVELKAALEDMRKEKECNKMAAEMNEELHIKEAFEMKQSAELLKNQHRDLMNEMERLKNELNESNELHVFSSFLKALNGWVVNRCYDVDGVKEVNCSSSDEMEIVECLDSSLVDIFEMLPTNDRRAFLEFHKRVELALQAPSIALEDKKELLRMHELREKEYGLAMESRQEETNEKMKRIASLEEILRKNESTIKEGYTQVKELKEEVQTLKFKLDTTVDASLYEELQANCNALEEEQNKLIIGSNEAQQHLAFLEKKLSEQKEQVDTNWMQLQQARGRIAEQEATIKHLQIDLDEGRKVLDATAAKEDKIKELSEMNCFYENECRQLNNKIHELQAQLADAKRVPPSLRELHNENIKLGYSNEELLTKNKHLTSTIDLLTRQIEDLKRSNKSPMEDTSYASLLEETSPTYSQKQQPGFWNYIFRSINNDEEDDSIETSDHHGKRN